MLGAYLPIVLLVVIAILFGLGSLVFSSLIGVKKTSKVKMSPYECGCTHPCLKVKFGIHQLEITLVGCV